MKTQITTILLWISLLALAVGSSGCAGPIMTASLPPRLTATEEARIKDARLPFTVGVVHNGIQTDHIDKLRKTKLFDTVDFVERLHSPPAVYAQWYRTPNGLDKTPIASWLTFGIIPTTKRVPVSFGCTFWSPRHPELRVNVEYGYESHACFGWLAAFLAFSPNVVMIPFEPYENRRFDQHITLAVLDHSEEIRKLTE